jgi:enhancer of polycomb-like protein
MCAMENSVCTCVIYDSWLQVSISQISSQPFIFSSKPTTAFRKMKQLRLDFEKVRVLMELVKQREELNRFMCLGQNDRFEQQIYDMVDTSGLPRVSSILRRDDVEEVLEMPRHFDSVSGQMFTSTIKKRRRLEQEAKAAGNSPPGAGGRADGTTSGASSSSLTTTANNGNGNQRNARPCIVAGTNFGEPAPNFLQPLPTRESYVSSWHNAVPAIASYENSHPTPTFYFRHRPRVGRGGRLVIDRLPRPIPSSSDANGQQPLHTVFVAGHSLPKRPKGRLLQLLPQPLPQPHHVMSRRVEELCAAAIRQDYETMGGGDEENDGDEVIVKVKDWLDTDDQLWGDERFAIGPI